MICYVFNGSFDGNPLLLKGVVKFDSLWCELVVLAWWATGRFLPAIGKETAVFHARKQRVDGAFNDEEICLFHDGKYVGDIGFAFVFEHR